MADNAFSWAVFSLKELEYFFFKSKGVEDFLLFIDDVFKAFLSFTELLLEQNADLSLTDNEGNTCLHFACSRVSALLFWHQLLNTYIKFWMLSLVVHSEMKEVISFVYTCIPLIIYINRLILDLVYMFLSYFFFRNMKMWLFFY